MSNTEEAPRPHLLVTMEIDGKPYGYSFDYTPTEEGEIRALAFQIGAMFHDSYLKHMGFEPVER